MKTTAIAMGVLLLVACGGSDTGGGALPLAKVAADVRAALCEKIYTCCSASERMTNPTIGTDRRSCQDALDGEASILLADIGQSVSQGRVIYHADKMATCLEDIKAASCDAVKNPAGDLSITEMCDEVFEPRVPVGGACSDYWDCAGGWCIGDQGGLKDMCVPLKSAGEECDEDPECGTGTCYLRACTGPRPGSGNICKIGTTDLGK
jgi:hypothetical protein